MRSGLPEGHGLSERVLQSSFVHRDDDGSPNLTDIQYEALVAGVAIGENLLAVAPTSSGKTDVGYFAALGWLTNHHQVSGRVVFLTSHKALARQKFVEVIRKFGELFNFDPSETVLATGDAVVDGNGDPAIDAFGATILVATYEKYLNILAGTGLDAHLGKVCCIADEVQLIGDKSRGQNVEILLTLLRESVGQMVALSAVLEQRYAQLLSDWLRARLVTTPTREVELIYELRTPEMTLVTSTAAQSLPRRETARARRTIQVLEELLTEQRTHEPIAVFCMTKQQVFDLASRWKEALSAKGVAADITQSPTFLEPTTAAGELTEYIPQKFAYHTADLNEDERVAVEARLEGDGLRVVFATTTLASGLNYSFRTVVVHSWQRWDGPSRTYQPIPRAEFHNMAGRAGRLSHVDRPGRAIFFAENARDLRAASQYLSWWELDEFQPRIQPENFVPLTLQLLSSNVANSEEGITSFLQKSFSAERELDVNRGQPEAWRLAISRSVEALKEWRLVQ
jgi:helicase